MTHGFGATSLEATQILSRLCGELNRDYCTIRRWYMAHSATDSSTASSTR